jgi:hypothetical protein
MITLNHILFDIKNIAYGGTQSDDVKISDRQVEYWIHQTRSLLIHNEMVKRNKINESFIQHIECVEMECVDSVECCDIDSDCFILRSVKPLPQTIARGGRNAILSVESVDKKVSFSETAYFRTRYNKFNKYTSDNRRWYIKDNYLYITNDLLIEYVKISGIFENPSEAGDFKTCDGDACYTNDSPYPVTMEMASNITDIVLRQKMGIARAMPNDEDNDAKGKEETAAQQIRGNQNSKGGS